MEHDDNSSNNNDNWSLSFILRIQHINLKVCQNTFVRLDKSFQNRQYRQVVDDATTVINQLPGSHLIAFYDIRSQANPMLGHYDAACADVKIVIRCAPDSAFGYLKKGTYSFNIWTPYGRYQGIFERIGENIKYNNNIDYKAGSP